MGSLSTIVKEKCPRCEKGDLFEYNKFLPFSSKAFQMKKYCPHCGLKYEKEVGFFYGAMFVSYALNIALFAVCIITYLLFFKANWGWEYFAGVYVFITLLGTAVIFRTSRSIWISVLTKTEPDVKDLKNLALAKEQ